MSKNDRVDLLTNSIAKRVSAFSLSKVDVWHAALGRLAATPRNADAIVFGYGVTLPVVAYCTWQGPNLEGRGGEP